MNEETEIAKLRLTVERCENALAEARKAFDRSNPETREITHVQVAKDRLAVAQGHLIRAEEVLRREAMKVEAEEQRQRVREPPSLQQLVLDHGTYDRITSDAWARFDAEMAEWKAKIRAGEFDAKIW